MRRLAAAVALATGLVLVPGAVQAQAQEVGCVLYANAPLDATLAVAGVGEQQCYPGLYTWQRLRIRLQEKKVIRFAPDEWHTKKITKWSVWSTLHYKKRIGMVDCTTTSKKQWRVFVDGQFINSQGVLQRGGEYSDEVYLPCHVYADVFL